MTLPTTGDRLTWLQWIHDSRPSILEQLNHWIVLAQTDPTNESSALERCELEESGIYVLIRRRTQGFHGNCLVIATVNLPEQLQNQGWLKSFLRNCCLISPWEKLIIEDVKNKILKQYCIKSGFKSLSSFYQDTFIINRTDFLSRT